jgi:integrase
MSVRKRKWKVKSTGEIKEAWIVDYVDQQGERTIETYERKKDADERHAAVKVDMGRGVHTVKAKKITVAQAADDWLSYVTGEGCERSTLQRYNELARCHIVPRIGREKLAQLNTPRINAFRDELLKDMSRSMAKKVLSVSKSILKDATRRGNVAQNAAASVSIASGGRTKPRLEVGRDIPTRQEVQRIVDAAGPGRARALLLTAALTGMRASELRGLRWSDVELTERVIHVRQRADRYSVIGSPKSVTSRRTIPIGDMVANTLREWRLQCPKGADNLVFPTVAGRVMNPNRLSRSALDPAQIAAGVIDSDGRPKYGMHSLRHFYASWCINRKKDGGLELPPKTVQDRLGHASIVITLDRYGHLFPSSDDGAELATAERALFAT